MGSDKLLPTYSRRAQADLVAATKLLAGIRASGYLADCAAFHVQQAFEKYLKMQGICCGLSYSELEDHKLNLLCTTINAPEATRRIANKVSPWVTECRYGVRYIPNCNIIHTTLQEVSELLQDEFPEYMPIAKDSLQEFNAKYSVEAHSLAEAVSAFKTSHLKKVSDTTLSAVIDEVIGCRTV